MRMRLSVLLLLGAIGIHGCGGGGGSDDGAFYGGVWRFSGIKFSDECNAGVSTVFNTVITVNQDQGRIVATSGQITLTGTTNDKDGFSVSATAPAPNGCSYGYAYEFRNASDGEADVGLGFALQCGNRICTVGYAGPGIRDSSRSISVNETDDFNKLEGFFSHGLEVEKGVELESSVQSAVADIASARR